MVNVNKALKLGAIMMNPKQYLSTEMAYANRMARCYEIAAKSIIQKPLNVGYNAKQISKCLVMR